MSPIATQNVARNVITNTEVIKIDDIALSREVTGRWKHSIIATAENILTKIVGLSSANGHTYIVESAVNSKRRFSEYPTPAANLGVFKYTTGVAEAPRSTPMAQEYNNYGVGLELFHTQQGVTIGLSKVLIASVPNESIVEFVDNSIFFEKLHHRISSLRSWGAPHPIPYHPQEHGAHQAPRRAACLRHQQETVLAVQVAYEAHQGPPIRVQDQEK